MKVFFVHLDLGIGGAEMLVVNAAVAAKKAGHEVVIYTSHHDPARCFEDTTGNGALSGLIRVRGDWLPRHLWGRFTALCAVWRMMWVSLCVVRDVRRGRNAREAQPEGCVVFCDGVSAPVPLLRLAAPVLFYCHFPDKLLCVKRGFLLKRLYRWPLDLLEEVTTGCASSVAVNSNFTAGIFREAFPHLGKRFVCETQEISGGGGQKEGRCLAEDDGKDGKPMEALVGSGDEMLGGNDGGGRGKRRLSVLYPPTNVKAYARRGCDDLPPPGRVGPVVSLNRFDRTKNLPLAVKALAWAVSDIGGEEAARIGLRLVVAGGYDERVQENVEHLEELRELAKSLEMEGVIEFRRNVGDEERSALLRGASCVLYTPSREHFGIVPVEAMCSGAPVIAVNSGGPLETVVHNRTGLLCLPTAEAFGSAIVKVARDPTLAESMGKEGRRRVQEKFSMESFAGAFDSCLREVCVSGTDCAAMRWLGPGFTVVLAFLAGLVASGWWYRAKHMAD